MAGNLESEDASLGAKGLSTPKGLGSAIGLAEDQDLRRAKELFEVRRRAEEDLRREKERAQAYRDVAGVMIVAIDARQQITLINKRACQVLGCEASEMLGKDWFEGFVPEGERDRTKAAFKYLMAGRVEPWEYVENLVMTRGGEARLIAWHNTVLRDGEGQIVGTLSSGEDISERRRTEEAVRSAALFPEENPSPVLRAGRDGTLLFANRAAAGLVREWQCRVGDQTPEVVRGATQRALEAGTAQELEVAVGGRRLSFVVMPIRERDYVNLYGRDVTEQKRAEAAVRESEEQFRTLADSIPNLAWWANGDGYITWYNRRWYEYTGTTPEQMEGWGWQSVHDPEVLPKVLEQWRASLATGEPFDMEFPLRGADGRFRLFLTRVQPVKDGRGRVVRWFGTNTDVDELKRTEAALQQAHQRLLYHTRNTPLAVIEFDADMRVSAWSDEARRVFGWEASEVLGKPMFEVPWVLEEDMPAIKEVAAGLYSGQTPRSVSPNRNVRKDGKVIWCEWYNSSLTDSSGKMQSLQSLVLEVTEQKRAVEAVQQSEARLAQAVRVAGLATFDHDHRTDVIEYSPVMRELMGFGEDEEVTVAALVGKVVPEDRESLAANIQRAHEPAGTGMFEVEFRVPRRAGGVRWISARSQTFFEGEGSGRRAVRTIRAALDVTEKREAQAHLERLVAERTAELQQYKEHLEELVKQRTGELLRTTEELKRSNRELEQFAYAASHDLQEPLRAVGGYVQLLEHRLPEALDAKARQYVKGAAEGAARMTQQIADLLELSRVGTRGLRLARVNLGAPLNTALTTMQFSICQADARVTSDPLPTLLVDEDQIMRLFQNLIGNSLKFCGERQPEIHVGAREEKNRWVIWVRDNGIGIDAQYFERIFQVFQRLHTREKYPGTGVGLSLCRRVVERHGGQIWVESQAGQGATFYFSLPESPEGDGVRGGRGDGGVGIGGQ
jgi:PAS domain S-box-containing protein